MKLANWTCRYYGTPFHAALNVIFPAAIRRKKNWHRLPANATNENIFPPHRHGCLFSETLAIDGLNRALLKSSLIAENFQCILLHESNFRRRVSAYVTLANDAWSLGKNVLIVSPKIRDVLRLKMHIKNELSPSAKPNVLCWHSDLKPSEQCALWNPICRGSPHILIGTSAIIFFPLQSPSLTIVDEEHDSAYKREKFPHFCGRDCAVYRAKLNGGLCLLGSGSPSMESMHAVNRKKYGYWKFAKEDEIEKSFPNVHVVNLQLADRSFQLLSELLIKKIDNCLQRKLQIVLLFNYFGYGKGIICRRCGTEIVSGNLDSLPKPGKNFCPKCCHRSLRIGRMGTKAVEEILHYTFPDVSIVRCDRGPGTSQKLVQQSLEKFNENCFSILIGTSLAADAIRGKNVGLACLLSSDQTLNRSDFRAAEESFQFFQRIYCLCTQRDGDVPIELVFQTRNPKNIPLQAVIQNRPELFYDQEFVDRKSLDYPPYRRLIAQKFLSREKETLETHAMDWMESFMEQYEGNGISVKGPFEGNRHLGQHSQILYYLAKNPMEVTKAIAAMEASRPRPNGIEWMLDVDAKNFTDFL
jgi:primosomal protein N' (replication factor Y)